MYEIQTYSKHLKPYARALRKAMTPAEQALWSRIRRRQISNVQFLRQRPLQSYIVDFSAKAHKLVIEVDGPIHSKQETLNNDKNKDEVFKALGICVLRFTNEEVLDNLENVVLIIKDQIQKSNV